MAIVYKAVQKNLERYVALKVVYQNLIHDKEFLSRFERKAKLNASLRHYNIIDICLDQDIKYISMEYLEGMEV